MTPGTIHANSADAMTSALGLLSITAGGHI